MWLPEDVEAACCSSIKSDSLRMALCVGSNGSIELVSISFDRRRRREHMYPEGVTTGSDVGVLRGLPEMEQIRSGADVDVVVVMVEYNRVGGSS